MEKANCLFLNKSMNMLDTGSKAWNMEKANKLLGKLNTKDILKMIWKMGGGYYYLLEVQRRRMQDKPNRTPIIKKWRNKENK